MWPDLYFVVSHCESTVDLISLVEELPALYDLSDRKHRDCDVIAALWKQVAAELNSRNVCN